MENDSTPQPQDSHLALDRIYKEAPVGLCAFDTDLRYIYINAWLAALNGISEEDHLGRMIGEVLPDLASSIEPQLQKVIGTGQSVVEGTAFGSTMARSGDKRHFQHTYQPIMSSDGSIIGVNCVVLDVTKHKRVEETLSYIQFAIDHAVDPAFFIRRDGRFFYVNEAACRTLGYSREELLSLSVPDITPDYPRGTWADRWREMRDRRNITFEGHHRTKDGSVFPVEVTTNYLEFQGNEYNCAFARDITERKQAEEKLAQHKTLLEMTFRCVPDALVLTNTNREIIMSNVALTRIFGYEIDEVLGKKTVMFYENQDEYERQGRTRFNLRAEAKHAPYVVNYRTKNGKVFPGETAGTVITGNNGEVLAFLGVIRDITERRQAEESLRESESRLRAIYEAAHDAILVVDPATVCIVEANTTAARLLGYTKEELLGLSCEVIHPKEMHQLRAIISKTLSCGGTLSDELTCRAKDGHRVPVEIAFSNLRYQGQVLVLAMIRDITERRQSERTIKASLYEKDFLVKEIQHRVKNNLQLIDALLELQRGTIADPQAIRAFHELHLRIHAMALVHDQLYQARDLSKVNLKTYLSQLVDATFRSHGVPRDRIVLNFHIQPRTLPLDTAMACGLLVSECISNALKHAFPPDRSGAIEVTMRRLGSQKISLTVRDNGLGMPKTLDTSATLGMQLIKTVAERQLQGTLRFRRRHGTSISMVFPLQRPPRGRR